MADAMLSEKFKTSHPDLVSFGESKMNDESPQRMYAKGEKARSLPTRKSVEFAIDPPSIKRSRKCAKWTAQQVVNGTFVFPSPTRLLIILYCRSIPIGGAGSTCCDVHAAILFSSFRT